MTEPTEETDTEAEPETLELSEGAGKRRIAMSVDGRSVEVEGPDPLLEIVTVAAELWRLTEQPAGRPVGFGGAATLHTELAERTDLIDREDG